MGGNAAAGLEAWVYPLQILRGLKPSFFEGGSVGAVPGDRILRSIEYTPTTIVRTFASTDFTIRETLFVPRELGGAVISYEIESGHPIAVQLSFVPVMDLMWPVGFGGQELSWKADENAYEMHEPTAASMPFSVGLIAGTRAGSGHGERRGAGSRTERKRCYRRLVGWTEGHGRRHVVHD